MKVSKITSIFGALLICAVYGFSQQNTKYSPEQLGDIVTKKMDEFIHFKEGQIERVNEVNKSTAQKNYEIRLNTDFTASQKQEMIHENYENRKQFLQEVLSSEQFKHFLEFEQTMKTKKSKQTINSKSPATKNQMDQPNPEFGEL
jgi:hypothetical protein